MFYLRVIRNIGLILLVLGHYYFCGYVLSEVHDMRNYEPRVQEIIQNSDEDNSEVTYETVSQSVSQKKSNVIGTIEIPVISLRRNLYDVNSLENDVDKNIEILKSSNMPDEMGNLILAGHNGNTAAGHFRELHKVRLNDEIIITYNDIQYVYIVSKIYDVLKTGTVTIKRDVSRKTVSLITCLGFDRQLVVIGYLRQ